MMYSGRKNPSGYFNGLGGCELMSTSFKNINICLFPESSHSLFALESTRKIDDDNEDTTLTPLLAPSAGNLFFFGGLCKLFMGILSEQLLEFMAHDSTLCQHGARI